MRGANPSGANPASATATTNGSLLSLDFFHQRRFGSSKAQMVSLLIIASLIVISVYAFSQIFGAPKHRYGLMIDAGSTGSRMHTFTFTRGFGTGGKMQLISDDFFPVKPGLSSYKDAPDTAGNSLLPLLERSKSLIPPHLWAETPVYLRATAGLRMTGEEVANAILASTKKTLSESGFIFREEWASILGGNDEGIYSWITVNYLLGRDAKNTVGTLEMGGGSSQIAFVPVVVDKPMSKPGCVLPEEKINFMGKDMKLYTTSHLGYGLKKAKATMMMHFQEKGMAQANPCLSKGSQEVDVPFEGKMLTMTGTGDFFTCEDTIDNVLGKETGNCECGLCTYGQKAQPRPIKEYVAFAFYMERTVDIGLKSPLTLAEIRAKGKEVCSMSVEEVEKVYPQIANGQGKDLCFDLSFIHSHLSRGHGIPENDDSVLINVVSKINGVELGWALGAMFNELSKLDAEKSQ